jgi:glycosyltransferase involved in cell wall biosynthesis
MADRSVKILYVGIVMRKNWGGGEPIIAYETIEKLKNKGYKVISSYYSPDYDSKIGKGIGLVYSFLRMFILKKDSFKLAVNYYRREIRTNDPDIVISQYDYDTSIIDAAKKENRKIIMYIHIWWPICPKIDLFTFDKRISDGFNKKCKECILKSINTSYTTKGNLSHNIERLSVQTLLTKRGIENKMKNRIIKLNKADLIVVLSPLMKNILVSNGVDRNKISIIPDGIDCSKFIYNSKVREKIVLYMGGENELKGYDFFIKLAENIKVFLPETRFIATGKFKTRSKYIEYTGLLDRKDLTKLISIARLTIVPSIWNEPFSLVALESMASGTPVLAFDVGILKEIIKNGETGFVVEPKDVKDASRKAIALLTDDDLFLMMSDKARRSVCENYSEDKRIFAIEDAIKKLVDKN